MKYVSNFIILVLLAVAILFIVAMIFNFIGAYNVIRDLHRENDPLFWIVIGIYALIVVTGIAFYLRKRISRKKTTRNS
jgi:drug/metabolite transporter superfamily protein YnfA